MTRILDLFPSLELTPRTRRSFIEPMSWLINRPYRFFEEEMGWMPPANITEDGKEYIVTLELPGIDMKGLDISYRDGALRVKGEKKTESAEDECCYCSERYSGSFERSFRVPGEVKEDEIEATYKDGVLRVALSKSEKSQVKKIEVKH